MSVVLSMTNPSSVAEQKTNLRKQAAERRERLAAEYDSLNNSPDAGLARFAGSLIEQFAPTVVAGYWPVRSEINLLPLLSALENQGIRLCLPITGAAGTPLSFHYWKFGSELEVGRYGIHRPLSDAEQIYPDVICVPLLAFDITCQRLGYGGGYYDRTLARLRKQSRKVSAIGLAYAGQKTDRLIIGPYDEALDNILTPEGWLV